MADASASERRIVVPGYRIERELGTGAFGVVVAAISEGGQRVAVKVATAGDAVAAAQLVQEERALRAVGPPAAPVVYGAGLCNDGAPFLALELIEASTLSATLKELNAPMEQAEFARRARAIIDAVAAVHAAGYAHLDLKPSNIFIDAEGARLIDFGMARRLAERSDWAGGFAGTVEYASPEQCEEETDVDQRADVYALGVILFEMLTGHTPFSSNSHSVREEHISMRPPRPSETSPVSEALDDLVLRCLAKERSQRFQSAVDLKRSLVEALASESPKRVAEDRTPEAERPSVERRPVGALFFSSSAEVGSVQVAVRAMGGVLAHASRGIYAAVFGTDGGQHPVHRALRAAQRLVEQRLLVKAVVDIAAVNAQRKADGTLRYLGPELGRAERYARDSDPVGILATGAAVELLHDTQWEPLPGREGFFVSRPADRLQPATVLQLGAGPLVGRDQIAGALVAAAQSAVDHLPTIMTVLGDPGYGKTRLAAAVVELLRTAVPFAELIDLRAREPVPGAGEETLRALLTRALELPALANEETARARFTDAVGPVVAADLWPAAALTLRLISPDATRVRALSAAPGVLRAMAMRAVGESLRALGRRRPVCLVLDDAHFADDGALDALEYAALAEGEAPLFVCVLARTTFAETRKAFGERAASSAIHHLTALPPDAAAVLCGRLLEPAENVPAAAIDRLIQRTQGIPLLLVELVRGLKRDGLVRKRQRGETWFLATDELDKLPELPLIEWLAQREIEALPRELGAHARLLSLLGSEFGDAEVRGVVSELDRQDVSSQYPLDPEIATRRLTSQGLLVTTRTGTFRFRHALVRDAVARSIPIRSRERIHGCAAKYYRRSRDSHDVARMALLAHHAAESGARDEAGRLYLALAEGAYERHAYLEAERSYTKALALFAEEDLRERLKAQRGRGSVRYRIGRYEDAFSDFDKARKLAQKQNDHLLEAEILLDAATALDWVTDFTRSKGLVDEAESLVGGSASASLEARLLLGKARALFRADRRHESCRAFQQAAWLAESVGDAAYETLIISLVMLEYVLAELGQAEEAARVAERAIALCHARGDQMHLVAALNNRRNVWVARKNVECAIDDQLAMMRIGRELGMLLADYFGATNLSELLYQADDLDGAAKHALRAIDIEMRHPEVASRGPTGILRLARIEAYRGRLRETQDLLRRIAAELTRALREGRASGVFSPSEKVLRDMVDLASREDATVAEWEALLERSARESVEQEPIEVADLYGTWALRRGLMREARRAFEEAAARAERIPNIMDARVRKGLEATKALAK